VGTAKTVTLAGAGLTGRDAGNYSLTSVGTAKADVTAKPITGSFTAGNKVYDGNTSATVTGRSLTGVVGSDVVSLSGGVANFDTKNVGTGKTVTLTGATLTGGDAGNYTLTSVGTAKADITAKLVTVTASSPGNIVVGSAVPVITASYNGWIRGESDTLLTTKATCTTGYSPSSPVATYTTTCTGAAAQNYSFTYVTGSVKVVYGWNGFLQPINDTAHQVGLYESKFKLGQTIPVKFDLTDAAGQVVQQSGNPTFTKSDYLGVCEASASLDTVPTVSPDGATVYSYNGVHYQYNWSTKSITKSGEYRIYANLADGTSQSVYICLTK
jgi:hypothetical protein